MTISKSTPRPKPTSLRHETRPKEEAMIENAKTKEEGPKDRESSTKSTNRDQIESRRTPSAGAFSRPSFQAPSSPKDTINQPTPNSWASVIAGISKKTSNEPGQGPASESPSTSTIVPSTPSSAATSKVSLKTVLPAPSSTEQSSLAEHIKKMRLSATEATNYQAMALSPGIPTTADETKTSRPKSTSSPKSAWATKSLKVLSPTADSGIAGASALSSGPKQLSPHPRAHEKRVISHEPGRVANGQFIAKDNLRWDVQSRSLIQHAENHPEIEEETVRKGYIKLAKSPVTATNPATRIQTDHTNPFNPRENRTAGDAVMSSLYPKGYSEALAGKPVVVVVNAAGSDVVTGYPLIGKSGHDAARKKIEKEIEADNKRLEKQNKGL